MTAMQPNPVLAEFRHTRDEMAPEAGYDVRKFMKMIRERERESAARCIPFAEPVRAGEESSIVREEPPPIRRDDSIATTRIAPVRKLNREQPRAGAVKSLLGSGQRGGAVSGATEGGI